MTDQIIATFGFIGVVFGLAAAMRIALRASLIARLLIEDFFAAPRQMDPSILGAAIDRASPHERPAIADPHELDLRLAA